MPIAVLPRADSAHKVPVDETAPYDVLETTGELIEMCIDA